MKTIQELCLTRLPKNMGIQPSDIQVLSPSRKHETGTKALNLALQAVLNPPAEGKKEKKHGDFSFRSGDMDPAIVTFLAQKLGVSAEEVINICNKKSGVLGLSDGFSNDFRDLAEAAEAGNEVAATALETYPFWWLRNGFPAAAMDVQTDC